MLKKLLLVVVVAGVGATLLAETKLGSRIRAWASRMEDKIDENVDPDDELKRIRFEVGRLDKDIDKVKGELAEANVNVRLLKREVTELAAEVQTHEKTVHAHGEAMKAASEGDKIQWGHRVVNYVDAKGLLAAEVKRHNDLKGRLSTKQAMLASQAQTRDLIDQHLQEMIAQKELLASDVQDMENEVKLAKIEQTRSKYQNDGTRMAQVKKDLSALRKRVMVQREKLVVHQSTDRNPASEKSVEEILAGLNQAPNSAPAIAEVKVIEKKP